MDDESFHSGLNIAGYCLTMAGEDLRDLSKHPGANAVDSKLLQIHENLDNCVLIIESLKLQLAAKLPAFLSRKVH